VRSNANGRCPDQLPIPPGWYLLGSNRLEAQGGNHTRRFAGSVDWKSTRIKIKPYLIIPCSKSKASGCISASGSGVTGCSGRLVRAKFSNAAQPIGRTLAIVAQLIAQGPELRARTFLLPCPIVRASYRNRSARVPQLRDAFEMGLSLKATHFGQPEFEQRRDSPCTTRTEKCST
jgi:hypothetical protein